MDVFKKSVVVFFVGLLVFSFSGCQLTNDLSGNDYIEYYNGDRAAIVGDYIGSKVKNAKSDVTEIQARVEAYSGSLCYVYVDNNNADYFYNGVVTVAGPNETVKVNVWMLAPGCSTYCMIKLEKDSASYCKTEITGNFYEYNTPAWEMISDYKITYVDHSVQVVFSTDTFEDTLLKQAADVFYANETIRNSATVTYYYLYDQNYADTTDYDYYMYVNAPNKEVTIYDKAGNIVREIRY